MDSLRAGQEKAWNKGRAGLGESSLFSLATSLASTRLKILVAVDDIGNG
jgi:hypothetical protein